MHAFFRKLDHAICLSATILSIVRILMLIIVFGCPQNHFGMCLAQTLSILAPAPKRENLKESSGAKAKIFHFGTNHRILHMVYSMLDVLNA